MKFPSSGILLVEPEPFYLPHLIAKLASNGRVSMIVVRHSGKQSLKAVGERWRRLIAAWGLRTLFVFFLARIFAFGCDIIFPDRFYSIDKVARRFRLPLRRVERVHSPEFYDILARAPDPYIFAQVSLKLRADLLNRGVFINKHCGLLPSYAGIFPVYWALLNRESRLGVTIHRMTEEYDAGEILAQAAIDASGHSISSAYHALYDRAADLLLKLFGGETIDIQSEGLRSYFSWPTATERRRFLQQGGRFGSPFRLHPKVFPAKSVRI